MAEIICLTCKTKFKVKDSHVYRRRTCSRKCCSSYRSEKYSGEGNHQFGLKGDKNSSFVGDITYKNGYVFVYLPDHPYNINGRVRLHRAIAERTLEIPDEFLDEDGYILPWIDVHHKDENPLNNDPENLEVLSRGQHTTLHNRLGNKSRKKQPVIGVFKQGELLES